MSRKVLASLLRGIGGRASVAIIGFFLTMALPRYLEVEEVGKVYFCLTIAALLSIFFRFGADNTASAIAAKALDDSIKIEKEKIIAVCISLSLVGGSVWLLLVYVGAVGALIGAAVGSADLIAAGAMGMGLTICYMLFQLYRIDGEVFLGALTRGFFHNFMLLWTVPLGASLNLSYDKIIIISSLSVLMASSVNLIIYARRHRVSLRLARRKELERFISWKLMAYSLLLYFITDADYYFIKGYLSDADLGVYASTKRLAVLVAIYIDLAHLVLPSIYRESQVSGNHAYALSIFRKLALLGFVSSGFLTLATFIYAEDIFSIIWGEEYKVGADVLTILVFTFSLTLAFGFSEMWLLLNEERDALYIGMGAVLFMCLGLNHYLTPIYGVKGAAWSFMVSMIALRVSLAVYVRVKYRVWLTMWWH